MGGIAATKQVVIFGDRDLEDFHDVYRCLDTATGEELWQVQQLAINSLDYGNSPRATPLIYKDSVFLFGASGDLLCVSLADGEIRWSKNIKAEFMADDNLPWGYCGSPLIANNMLIVNPGSETASVVALETATGDVVWQAAGSTAAYGSFLKGTFGGTLQIVGHDKESLCGWDTRTGKKLWSVAPKFSGEFLVPTPVNLNGQLLVTTESNGTRLFGFHDDGKIKAEPVSTNRKLAPSMSTPIVVNDRVYCVDQFLYCLNAEEGLQEEWRLRDPAFGDYAAMFASDKHLLIVGRGELLLLKADGSKKIVSRQKIFDQQLEIYSHPALVGQYLYVRGENSLKCIRLAGDDDY